LNFAGEPGRVRGVKYKKNKTEYGYHSYLLKVSDALLLKNCTELPARKKSTSIEEFAALASVSKTVIDIA
jgi:hypothetical protein